MKITPEIQTIVDTIVFLSDSRTHPDKVARIYQVFMDVGYALSEEMLKVEDCERCQIK